MTEPEQTTKTVSENGTEPQFTPPELQPQEWMIVKELISRANDPTAQGKLVIGQLLLKIEKALG